MATEPLVTQSSAPFVDESRFERVDGRLVERPVPGDIHADTQEAVRRVLADQSGNLGVKARSEWSVTRSRTAGQSEPDYLTPDVLVARVPYQRTSSGHLIPPGFLAVEIASPGQRGLFRKAELLGSWGIEHVWIIDPETKEAFEYHGGNQFTLVDESLTAGELSVRLADIWPALE